MRKPVRQVTRLLDAASFRTQIIQRGDISATESGVLRALAWAFGNPPGPLPEPTDIIAETDIREEFVMKIVGAN